MLDPLPGGGLCLHLQTKEDETSALGNWPPGAFQSDNVQPHIPASRTASSTVIVRNVDTRLTVQSLQVYIEREHKYTVTVRRYRNRHTGKPMPIISVRYNSCHKASQTITSGLSLNDKLHPCEPKRATKVVRCFKCQSFGHISHNCKQAAVCVNCGEHHETANACTVSSKCANCAGNHTADSSKCPAFRATQTKLRERTVQRIC
jgi:hypothetical protein